MAKNKVKFTPEEQVIAKNLGVQVEEPAPKKAKPDVKKVRRMREAIQTGAVQTVRRAEGPATKEGFVPVAKLDKPSVPGKEIADTREQKRYEATLARTSLLNDPSRAEGVAGVQKVVVGGEKELEAAQNQKADEARKKEKFNIDVQTARKSRRTPKSSVPKYDPSTDPESSESKKAAKEKLEKSQRTGGVVGEQLAKAMREGPGPLVVDSLGDLDVVSDANRGPSSASQDAISGALTYQKTKEINKAVKRAGRTPIFSEPARPSVSGTPAPSLAAAASLRALRGGEAPTLNQTTDITSEEYLRRFEKQKGKINKATGKPVEDIEIPGNETYTDASGKQTSINAEALRMAQLDHDSATRTGRTVNGIKPTDKRPERFEDIALTPHQNRAFITRHLPVTNSDIDQSPGLERASFDVKNDALTELAKDKYLSGKKIDITNEVDKRKHKGYIDQLTGKKTAFKFHPKTGEVLNAPSNFTRTARPIAAISVGDDEDTTENLMGAAQVASTEDQENKAISTPGVRETAKGASVGNRIGKRVPDLVTSHEGWVPNAEGYYENIKHPIPEANRVHIADVTAGKILGHIENKEEAKKSKKPNTGMGIVEDVKEASSTAAKKEKMFYPLGSTARGSYDTDIDKGLDPLQSRNPMPPKGSTSVLLKNQGITPSDEDLNAAVKSRKIKREQAEALSPQWAQREATKANSPIAKSRAENLTAPEPEGKSFADMTPKERKAYKADRSAKIAQAGKRAEKKRNASKPAGYYDKYTDVSPYSVTKEQEESGVQRPVSAAYAKAAATVKQGRHTVPYEHKDTMLEQEVHDTQGPVLVRKKNPLAGKTTRLMADERGPITEKEITTQMFSDESKRQGLPERSDVKDALKAGHISKEEAKGLRTMDQFSLYRNVSPETGKRRATDIPFSSPGQMKYARLYEPTMPAAPKVDKGPGTPVSELNAATTASRMRTVNDISRGDIMGEPIPLVSKPRQKKKVENPVSEGMRSYYGEYESVDKLKNKGPRYGKPYEGSGQQFTRTFVPDTLVKHEVGIGELVNHQEYGMGRVVGHVPQGQAIPGTGEKHKNGRIKKGTQTMADVPHLSVSFGDHGIKHIPAVENVSENARQQAAETVANTKGMRRAGAAGATASYISGRQSLKPKLEILESPEK
jgi:hypothetical protein